MDRGRKRVRRVGTHSVHSPQQTGRLASDEDKSDFANRCASRQEVELTPMIEELVRCLQASASSEYCCDIDMTQ